MRLTVTLARQLGSGGSYFGQRLAEQLHARCLDREIVSRTAEQLACDEDELAEREERVSSFWERMLRGMSLGVPEALYVPPSTPSLTDQDVFMAETEVMKEIARREDCVIVGRVAAHVLPPHPGMVNLFLSAPLDFRVQRVMQSYQLANEAQARTMIMRSDEVRKRFIAQMTGREWDDARNYHLCIDTSSLPWTEITEFLIDYIGRKTGRSA